VTIKSLRDVELDEFLQDCETIAGKTYQRRLKTGFINDLTTQEILRVHHQTGRPRGYVLYLASHPSAFIIILHHAGMLHARFMGYDPQYSHLSPGSFLLMHCIEDSLQPAAGPVRKIDFGPGNHRYKREICNQMSPEATVTVFAPTPKWIIVNLFRTSLALTRKAAIRFLGKPKVRDASVRLWRQFAGLSGRPCAAFADYFLCH
jgi:hypothetical protein